MTQAETRNTSINDEDQSSLPAQIEGNEDMEETTSHIDDDMTEINIEEGDQVLGSQYVSRLERLNDNRAGQMFWTEEEEAAYEEQRRERLSEELQRIQRTNFIHFGILCLVPVFLLVLVIASAFNTKGPCEGFGDSECRWEERMFMNAFATKCICTGFGLANN